MSTDAAQNASYLRIRFVARLLSAQPESVLDIGAGGGEILASLRAAGVQATGCESDAARAHELERDGFVCLTGDATALPLEGGAFDWVAMRHVPHHLEDPARAIAEAERVARRGVLVAEPWFDLDFPSQVAALAADRWLKRQHRRAGMVHGENLSAAELVACASSRTEVEVAHLLRLRRRAPESLVLEATPWLAALSPDDPDRAEWAEVLERVAVDGLSFNGSVVVALTPSNDASV